MVSRPPNLKQLQSYNFIKVEKHQIYKRQKYIYHASGFRGNCQTPSAPVVVDKVNSRINYIFFYNSRINYFKRTASNRQLHTV